MNSNLVHLNYKPDASKTSSYSTLYLSIIFNIYKNNNIHDKIKVNLKYEYVLGKLAQHTVKINCPGIAKDIKIF
jgi:hypothetical protein